MDGRPDASMSPRPTIFFCLGRRRCHLTSGSPPSLLVARRGKSASPVHAGRAFARMKGCTLTQAPAAAMGSSQIPPCDDPALHDRGRKRARRGIEPNRLLGTKERDLALDTEPVRYRGLSASLGWTRGVPLTRRPVTAPPTVSLAATGCHASPFPDRRRSPLAIGGRGDR
jgi:hypothetical protein